MLPIPDLALVADLSDVDWVAQQCIDLTARERIATLDPPLLEAVQLGSQSQLIGPAHDGVQAAEFIPRADEDKPRKISVA